MCIGQSSSTPTRRCGEFRWLRHGRRPLLLDPGSWILAPVAPGSFAGSGRQGPGSRVEKRAPGAHGSPEAFVFTRFRSRRWWHPGIRGTSRVAGALSRDPGEGPDLASERPWVPGRPRPPGRPKPDPHSGQFPQAHDENSDTIPYGADPGNLPPPKAGKPEMC